jgi:four helix bundle protein
MFRFREFKVYKDAKKFAATCEKALKPIKSGNFPLISQVRSAYISIVLNIAEGSACDSDKEFARFLEISLRSVHEVVAAFDLCFELGLVDGIILKEIDQEAESLCKQINGFRRSLKKS